MNTTGIALQYHTNHRRGLCIMSVLLTLKRHDYEVLATHVSVLVQPTTHAVHREYGKLFSRGCTNCMWVDLVSTARLHPCSIQAYRCSHSVLRLGYDKQTGRLNLWEATSVASHHMVSLSLS